MNDAEVEAAELGFLASEDPQRRKATQYLKLPNLLCNPTIGKVLPSVESLLCLFLAAYPCCCHFILSMGELQDNGDFRPALWSLVLLLAAGQALARTDSMYLLFWGDSLFEDLCAAFITGLALRYTLTTEFLFASILFGFSFFKTVRLICSRVRHPEHELPTLLPRRRRFAQVAIRWAGSVILVALGGLVVPCWWPAKYFCSEWWGHHYVWPHLLVVLEFVDVAVWYLGITTGFCLGVLILVAWLFVMSTNVFSLRELTFISEPGCCSNVRNRLMVLLRTHRGVEELNRLFLDLVAVGKDPAAIDVVLEHGAQVDTQESLALRMACDPFGPQSRARRASPRLLFSPEPSMMNGYDVTTPIVRCLLNHGATPPAGCAVGSLSVGTLSCLVEFGHREALHHPVTFGNAVCCQERAMIEYLMQQGADVDAGMREACALRGPRSTVGIGLDVVIRNTPVTAPLPFTDDTMEIARQGDPIATAVLLLTCSVTPMSIEGQERESIARSCLERFGYEHVAVKLLTEDMVPVESEVAEEILVHAAGDFANRTPLMDRLGSLRFPKRALDHALARALQAADVGYTHSYTEMFYERAKKLLQHGASLPVGYEEETARSHNARRAQFVREAIEMHTAPLTKAAR